MRKIEADMLTAVQACQYWRSGNTEVIPFPYSEVGAHVYLHGNHIADVPVGGPVVVNIETLRRWPTSLTASRLRALGANLSFKGGQPYIDGLRV